MSAFERPGDSALRGRPECAVSCSCNDAYRLHDLVLLSVDEPP